MKKRTEPRIGTLPRRRKIMVYTVSIGSLVTGVVWLLYHYFIRTVDQFGFESPDPNQKWWIIAHAVFSFFAVWAFGVLWTNHVQTRLAGEGAAPHRWHAVRLNRVADADGCSALLYRSG